MLPTVATWSPSAATATLSALAFLEIEDLLARPGLGGDRRLLGDEAARPARGQQDLALGPMDREHHRLGAAAEIDLQAKRLALAAAAGQALDRRADSHGRRC